MYKIGEFSIMSRTTIKTLRYYEKEKLLIPAFIDPDTGYRYYESKQLSDLSKILSLRSVGLSIKDIKKSMNGHDLKELLTLRKKEIEDSLSICNEELSKINYLMEDSIMNNEIIVKELPDYVVYYKEGVISNLSEVTSFILKSAEECLRLNPNLKCIEPDYCYTCYLDNEYRETNIHVRYAQAVVEAGVESDTIKFMKLKPVDAVCIYHKGSYASIRESYAQVMKYIEENGYEIIESPRERYIDGMWNKENENDWLTEIQVPIKKK